MNKILKYMGIGAVVCLAAGCTDNFEKYNTHPYRPTKVPANTLLSKMFEVYASPQQNDCQFNNTMWACFSGQVTAPQNWSKGENIFAYYNAVENFNGATWGILFSKTYPNFFRIEKATEKKGVIYAIARLTRIYAMQTLASLQGPIPYTQVEDGKTEAAYDTEKEAWHAMFSDLNEVISTLKTAKDLGINADLAAVDQFYAGDCNKWLKFANTLKLRMAIRISGADPEYACKQAEDAVRDGVMESVDDSSYDKTHSGQGVNGYSVVSGWGELKANACLVSYMNGYNDPRRSVYFTEQTQTAKKGFVGVRSGSTDIPSPATYANYSNIRIATEKQSPQPVMFAAEAAFLRAEGALKKWNMDGKPEELYKQGIRLAFQEFKVQGVEDYLNNDELKPGNYEDNLVSGHAGNNHTNASSVTIKWDDKDPDNVKLEKILTQKWIALFPDPLNGWADYRRTGYPRIFPATKSANPDCTPARGQRRLRFPDSEYNTNKEHVEAAVKMLSNGKDSNGTDLWWALKK